MLSAFASTSAAIVGAGTSLDWPQAASSNAAAAAINIL
jgi:hypothetical protein